MLADVVAHAEHQRAIHAFGVGQLRRHGRRHRTRNAVDALELDRVQAFFEGRRAHHHRAVGVHDEGIAVEHQFVLAAEHVHVHHRQAQVAHAAAHDVFAIRLLVQLVRRGIQHHEHLGAGGARQLRGLRLPDVLAHQDAERKPRNSTTVGWAPDLK